ncbi:MAG TPA: bacillithiol biosynthesis cysteine-adding enzyme BshC [Chitinophagaceae bacterium]|nr:bacillithiol biosynthesis cysteine-adding enzyme BshC [Chitinophagaceae bacterium]HNJ57652.1 bacillithiol biosynthesis cysteine-adding enzyme BshC [Chitinophagaceae bacterium]
MKINCSHLTYKQTGFFSKIVLSYLNSDKELQPFFEHNTTNEGLKNAIASRKNFKTNRKLLVEVLEQQYQNIPLTALQEKNLKALLHENTFTVTTAHQPNIFTGPLYFIYKILHVIKLADDWNKHDNTNYFVPIYFMGSEDADFEELSFINLEGEKLSWKTNQTGAIGRMLVDENLIQLIDKIAGQIGIYNFGNELITNIKLCYTLNKNIEQATIEFVNILFKEFGLLILIPDNSLLKNEFKPIIEKELAENFSNKYLEKTVNELNKNFKIQTLGRQINLFYLQDNQRYRIIKEEGKFGFKNTSNEFQQLDIQYELKNSIKAFSPNVILRGVFQEMILPNIAFVGGGGELAYWLELKNIFNAVNVPYPVLILRNSFLIVDEKNTRKINQLLLQDDALFLNENDLINSQIFPKIEQEFSLKKNKAIEEINDGFANLISSLQNNYPTLAIHTKALHTNSVKRIQALEKKILKAEKRKNEEVVQKLKNVKHSLFPKNNLQERVENFAILYAKYGAEFLQVLFQHSLTTEQLFTILKLDSKVE